MVFPPQGTGGVSGYGVTKLSELEIDADKDWNNKTIYNVSLADVSNMQVIPPSMDSPIRISRDGYLHPIAGSFINMAAGTDTTPNNEGCFGIFVYMHSSQAPGPGVVRGPFYSILKIASSANFYGFGYTSEIIDLSSNYGEHVGFYANIKGTGAGALWGFACEVYDNYNNTWNYNKTIVGMEIAMFKQNSNSVSVGLEIIAKGDKIHNSGIRIYGEGTKWDTGININANYINTWCMRLEGSCPVGISLEEGNFSSAAIRIKSDNKIDLEATGVKYIKYDSALGRIYISGDTRIDGDCKARSFTTGDITFENGWVMSEAEKHGLGEGLILISPDGKKYRLVLDEV